MRAAERLAEFSWPGKLSVDFQRSLNISMFYHDSQGAKTHEGISHTWLRGDQHGDPKGKRPKTTQDVIALAPISHFSIPIGPLAGMLARILELLRNARRTKKKRSACSNAPRMIVMTQYSIS